MRTPREKYMSDPHYSMLVKSILAHLHNASFTPSEVREASILACILYEEQRVRRFVELPEDIQSSLKVLNDWTAKEAP